MKENHDGYGIKACDELMACLVKHATWLYNGYLFNPGGRTPYG